MGRLCHGASGAKCYSSCRSQQLSCVFRHDEDKHVSRLLHSERNAMLLVDALRSQVVAGKFQLHDFVVMPDHSHLLLTLAGNMTIERVMQLTKGGFSYRLRKELGFQGEVWQRGFSEVRILDQKSFLQHRVYIVQNPVKAGLVEAAEQYPYCYTYLANLKAQGLKP